MRRRASNFLCAFSLLIFLLSVTLGTRSYFVAEGLSNSTEHTQSGAGWGITRNSAYGISWELGKLEIFCKRTQMLASQSVAKGWEYHSHKPTSDSGTIVRSNGDRINLHLAGSQLVYSINTDSSGWRESYFRLLVPFWIFLIFAVPPLLWWRKRRQMGGRGFAVAMAEGASRHAKSNAI